MTVIWEWACLCGWRVEQATVPKCPGCKGEMYKIGEHGRWKR